MAAVPRPSLNRIPGGDIALPQAKEKHTKDLTTLTHVELLEMKEREQKLLSNRAQLSRLPDKGKRIRDFYDKILAELDRRSNVDEAVAMFSDLNIASKAKNALNALEWSGKLEAMHENDPTNDVLDSDDEQEMDPLRVIAKGTMHERSIKILPPEPKLITAEDLAEIASFNTDSTCTPDDSMSTTSDTIAADLIEVDIADKLNNIKSKLKNINTKTKTGIEQVEPHVRYVLEKTELQTQSTTQRDKFKPYKTTITDVHAPEKERTRKKGKHWEITAATPPPIQHNSTQMLPLLDSVQIQANYLEKLKTLQEQQAAERLAAKIERLSKRNLTLPDATLMRTKSFTTYRENIEGSGRFNETEEVDDVLENELSAGGVTYTVYE